MRLQLTLLLLLVLAGASWALPQCSPTVVNLNTDKMVLAVIGGGRTGVTRTVTECCSVAD
jgi:hypothetical protein